MEKYIDGSQAAWNNKMAADHLVSQQAPQEDNHVGFAASPYSTGALEASLKKQAQEAKPIQPKKATKINAVAATFMSQTFG